MKNVKVGPLSAVSPETLRSVYRVLMWNLRTVPTTVHSSDRPSGEDERVALEFARAIRFCFSPAAVRRAEELVAIEEGRRLAGLGEEALPNVGQSWEEWDWTEPRKGVLDTIIDEPLFGKAGE